MRMLVDIDDTAVAELDRIAQEQKISRDTLVREAVAALLARRSKAEAGQAFGLWAEDDAAPDGLSHQRSMRREW